jgi:uncharacterized membrane protein
VTVPDRLAMMLAALFVVVGLVFAIGSWGSYLTDTHIARDGGRATGTITDKSVSRGDDDTDYLLQYRFALPDGGLQTGQHGIAKADWATRQIGAPLAISYDRNRPSRNFPAGYGVTSLGMTIFMSVLGAVFAAFGAVIFVAPWKWPADRPRPPPRRF